MSDLAEVAGESLNGEERTSDAAPLSEADAAFASGEWTALDARAVTLWRIGELPPMVALLAVTTLVVLAVQSATNTDGTRPLLAVALAALALAPLVFVRVVVMPPLRLQRWRWQLSADHLLLQRGVFTHRNTIVPLVRVQNVDTVQGPIARRFGLWSVIVYTAAHPQEIPYLRQADADRLRESIAELARRAREED